MTAQTLLIEIGTEELPPKSLDELAKAFFNGVIEGLLTRRIANTALNSRDREITYYCSPRRLTVSIRNVDAAQPDQMQERRGPALNAGLDASGQPTKALLGFAQSCGVTVEQLEKLETDKGSWFVHRASKKGQPTAALIPEIVAEALKALPIPKPMRWGNHEYSFVRPVHSLVMLHGDQVIEGEIFGVKSDRFSSGHRFHHHKPVWITHPDAYLDALRSAKVLADPNERRARVRSEIERVGRELNGIPQLSDGLLHEIANLTEWPVAIGCTFDPAFLAVPHEALVMTMETNQKFVPVFDSTGKLTERFIGIANIDSKDPAEIRKGYERVIRPRFADAKFFYDEDLKSSLESHQATLKNVTYQQALGSVWDKCVRVAELARVIANRLNVDAGLATRAAALSKCDLMTRMVGEFPELQGVMGRYYATAAGENSEIAQALDTFYAPRFAGDKIAQGKVGQVVAIAERLDTLAGIFAVGQKPSGNKDPFALRRAALGLARTLIEGNLELDLKAQIAEALALLPEPALSAGLAKNKEAKTLLLDIGQRRAELANELYEFILDRLRGYYADQSITGEAFEAVRALSPESLTDFDRRLRAVVEFSRLPEAQALAAANKRIGNILRQAGQMPSHGINAALLDAGAEQELTAAVSAAQADTAPLIESRDYVGVFKRLAQLREPVDRFFDNVMVMADDTAKRQNRLALLLQLRQMFLHVADISLLHSST